MVWTKFNSKPSPFAPFEFRQKQLFIRFSFDWLMGDMKDFPKHFCISFISKQFFKLALKISEKIMVSLKFKLAIKTYFIQL